MSKSDLPDWFRAATQQAMLGEISPHVRMVVASLNDERTALLRFYIDREPSEDDEEQAAIVATNLSAMVGKDKIAKLKDECVYATQSLGQLDVLDGVLFLRMQEPSGH